MAGPPTYVRRYPFGAEPVPDRGTHFRVWAPGWRSVEVVVEGSGSVALAAEPGGLFSALVSGVVPGDRYRFQFDGGPALFPDPASRYQPDGPHGPSQVIDPAAFEWHDADWPGLGREGQVLYALHVGTFTPQGTWAAAADRLPELAALGVTAVCVLPVADFPGKFGWGHDGTCPFAPTRLYGTPDDLRRFVDAAHRAGVGVILDVVYARLGPAFHDSRHSAAGSESLPFDGPDSGPVRDLFIANAACWVEEYHVDGLRLLAAEAMIDESSEHVIAAIARRAREAAGARGLFLLAEGDPADATLLRPVEAGGCGLDAVMNLDLHHAARVALTGKAEGPYAAYHGSPQELVSAAKWGLLYQGQAGRGTAALDVPPHRFVAFLEGPGPIADWGRGLRLHQLTSPGRYRALTAYLLLGTGTPMLFQGQETGSDRPFLYFADHHPELAQAVHRGRREAARRFRSLAGPEGQRLVPDPADPDTFTRCILGGEPRPEHLELHRDLLGLRRSCPAFRAAGVDGAVLGPAAFVLRYFVPGGDRLLVVNLGRDLALGAIAEPLLASPRAGQRWQPVWSSEATKYGGHGTAAVDTDEGWHLPGEAAVVLAPG